MEGCRLSYSEATRVLLRSTASRYWVRSLVPTEINSMRPARCGIMKIIEGTSSMMPNLGFGISYPSTSSTSRPARSINLRASSISSRLVIIGSSIPRLPVPALARSMARTWIRKISG
ncbi:hypothetical protein D3C80_1190420 [compost metagenome]